jgi:hypothetical protein
MVGKEYNYDACQLTSCLRHVEYALRVGLCPNNVLLHDLRWCWLELVVGLNCMVRHQSDASNHVAAIRPA